MTMKIKENLSFIEIETNPGKMVNKCIIWLHGLGADGGDFAPIVPELGISKDLNYRFVFPHAPIMPVTINNGYEMRAWFDIYGLNIDGKIDEEGIHASVKAVEQLIKQEIASGIAGKDIILAGFSQGAVIALSTGLLHNKTLGGVLALSGYLPNAKTILQNAGPANANTPIFIAHGTEDSVVPYALGKSTYVALKDAHYPVSWHSYPIAHGVCAEEIADISEWLNTLCTNRK